MMPMTMDESPTYISQASNALMVFRKFCCTRYVSSGLNNTCSENRGSATSIRSISFLSTFNTADIEIPSGMLIVYVRDNFS